MNKRKPAIKQKVKRRKVLYGGLTWRQWWRKHKPTTREEYEKALYG